MLGRSTFPAHLFERNLLEGKDEIFIYCFDSSHRGNRGVQYYVEC